MRRRALAGLVTGLLLAIGGCGLTSGNDIDNYLGRDDSGDTPLQERGSFEDARTRLDTMVDQIATEMTAAFPDCPPMQRDGAADNVSGGGTPKEYVDNVWPYLLNSQSRRTHCAIAHTRERADTAIEIATRIADDYGFQPHITFNDSTDNLAIEGWNADGDKYSFGAIEYTSISYRTAPRFTEEQFDAIRDGRTPPQPRPSTLVTPVPTPDASAPINQIPDDTTHERPHPGKEQPF